MKIFSPEDLSEEILNELLEEINELYENSEQTLIELELAPKDSELQNELFRSIHTIKGDLGLVCFEPMIPLLQHIEDLLDYLRNNDIVYTSTMSDLVLITMDKVKFFVDDCIRNGQTQYDDILFEALITKIQSIRPDNSEQHEKLLVDAVLLLDPSLAGNTNYQVDVDASTEITAEKALNYIGIGKLNAEHQQDITFFRQLMVPIDNRSQFWSGRSDRIAKLCLILNKTAGSPIDENQLAVACYVYDFGMACMPLSILHKPGQLTASEKDLVKSHVFKSVQLLEHFEHWSVAKTIVLQHHERMNGSGYPFGISGEDISPGAKLLAIVDTFDAITHLRAHETHIQRPKKRAVIELNRTEPGLFCPLWLQIFNKTMISLLSAKA
jgi:HD-GYP domain-containing protein (c-di-GMP phosphodiesterase class II)